MKRLVVKNKQNCTGCGSCERLAPRHITKPRIGSIPVFGSWMPRSGSAPNAANVQTYVPWKRSGKIPRECT